MDDLQRMMADFAARGGQVRRAEPGQGLGLSARQWRELARAPRAERAAILGEEPDDWEQIQEQRREAAHDARFTGDHEFAEAILAGELDDVLRERRRDELLRRSR